MWKWIDFAVVDSIHDATLAAHGGSEGVRDSGMVESALFRAPKRANYGDADAADLAAAYAFGLTKNHGYVDGNKRVAWIVARLFLVDNGHTLQYDHADAVRMMERLAAGEMTEPEVAEWFRSRIA